jgi:two-component sensor histidine kinase
VQGGREKGAWGDPCNSPSLGLQLVQVLVRQIGGKKGVDSGGGAHFRVKFTPPPGQDTHVAGDPR